MCKWLRSCSKTDSRSLSSEIDCRTRPKRRWLIRVKLGEILAAGLHNDEWCSRSEAAWIPTRCVCVEECAVEMISVFPGLLRMIEEDTEAIGCQIARLQLVRAAVG